MSKNIFEDAKSTEEKAPIFQRQETNSHIYTLEEELSELPTDEIRTFLSEIIQLKLLQTYQFA